MKKFILTIILALGMTVAAGAQSFSLTFAAELPTYEGASLDAFAAQVGNAVGCPEDVTGTVTVGFYVSKDGHILLSKVLKGISEETDAQVLAAVNTAGGEWKPALDKEGAPLDWYVTIKVPIVKDE